jgi:hypothetical protein
VLAVTGLTGAGLLGGCGAAAAPAAGTGGGGAAPAATAASRRAGSGAPAVAGRAAIIDYQANDSARSKVILTGAIGDFGQAVSIHPDGTADPQHDSELRLALTRGSFRLSIAGLDKRIVSLFRDFPPDTATCSGTVTTAGVVPIVAGSGTGAYQASAAASG